MIRHIIDNRIELTLKQFYMRHGLSTGQGIDTFQAEFLKLKDSLFDFALKLYEYASGLVEHSVA